MTHSILIDANRVIYAETEQSPVPAEFTALQNSLTGASVVTVATLPTNFRRWRILSSDGSACTDPGDNHASQIVKTRRRRVVEWAIKNTARGAALYGARDPNRFKLWVNVLRSILAAVYDDTVITDAAFWRLMESSLTVDVKLFVDQATGWSSHESNIASLSALHIPIQGIVDGPPNPRRISKRDRRATRGGA